MNFICYSESVKFYSRHALKSSQLYSRHALKGQKLLAQGIALGNYERKFVALFYSN